MYVIIRLGITLKNYSNFFEKLTSSRCSVRFLRGTYEKIVSSAADRPKLVVRAHGLTLNSKVSECHFLRFLRENLGK